jgi:hypothetical protein
LGTSFNLQQKFILVAEIEVLLYRKSIKKTAKKRLFFHKKLRLFLAVNRTDFDIDKKRLFSSEEKKQIYLFIER